VNVGDLDKVEGADLIDRESLVKAGLVRKSAGKIKILGNGEVTRALKVQADKFSRRAVEKITGAGGEAVGEEAPAKAEKEGDDAS
jgi:large subunit ribosomal protein L15